MYDRILNQSRASLTSNSSSKSRLVRKRDSNFSINLVRSRSKNKQEQCNTSFQEYLSKQSKLFSVENQENKDEANKQQRKNDKIGSEAKNDRLSNGSTSLSLSQTLSTIQIAKNTIVERGDRYIQSRLSADQNRNQDNKSSKQIKQANLRKREPTPVKSKKLLASENNKNGTKNENNQLFQFQLRIAGLEDALSLQKKLNQVKQKKFKQTLTDLNNVRQILSQIEMQNKILQNDKKVCQQKIVQLQNAVLQREMNLTQAQNNLNKLRQTIKQNRLSQLQAQNKKLQKQNTTLKQQSSTNSQIISSLNQKLKAANKQIQELKKFGTIQSFANKQSMKQQYLQKQLQKIINQGIEYRKLNQSQKEKFLQNRLQQNENIILQLKQQIAGLLVKVHCLQYFKSKQIQQIKQSYDSQLKNLRVKYSKMIVQLKTKKGSKITTPLTSPHIKKSPSNSPTKQKSNSFDIPCKCLLTNQNSNTNNNINSNFNSNQTLQETSMNQRNSNNYAKSNGYNYSYNDTYVANNNININITNSNYNEISMEKNNIQYRYSEGSNINTCANIYRPTSIGSKIGTDQTNRVEDCLFELSPE